MAARGRRGWGSLRRRDPPPPVAARGLPARPNDMGEQQPCRSVWYRPRCERRRL